MKKIVLGTSDIKVTPICLGSMNWGTYNTESQAHEQLDRGIELGVNFIDTAEIYPIPPSSDKQGLTEQYIGTWLAKRQQRDDLVIASKVCISPQVRTRQQQNPPSYDAKSIKEAIDGTLQRLQTDYIDLYQVHWPERETNYFGKRGYRHDPEVSFAPFHEIIETMHDLIKAGKIRAYGVSNETPWGIAQYLRVADMHELPRPVSIQNQYSLINRTYEIGMAEFSLRENIPLLVYSPLSFGVLSGKYIDDAKPEGARFTVQSRNIDRYNPPHAQAAIRAYVAIAEKYNLDPAAMAIAFARSRSFTGSVIIGTTSIEQMKVNVEAGDLELPSELLDEIEYVYTMMPDPTV